MTLVTFDQELSRTQGLVLLFVDQVREESKRLGNEHFCITLPPPKQRSPIERDEAYSQITVENEVQGSFSPTNYWATLWNIHFVYLQGQDHEISV